MGELIHAVCALVPAADVSVMEQTGQRLRKLHPAGKKNPGGVLLLTSQLAWLFIAALASAGVFRFRPQALNFALINSLAGNGTVASPIHIA